MIVKYPKPVQTENNAKRRCPVRQAAITMKNGGMTCRGISLRAAALPHQ